MRKGTRTKKKADTRPADDESRKNLYILLIASLPEAAHKAIGAIYRNEFEGNEADAIVAVLRRHVSVRSQELADSVEVLADQVRGRRAA